jgi:hypothetical protein
MLKSADLIRTRAQMANFVILYSTGMNPGKILDDGKADKSICLKLMQIIKHLEVHR